MVSNFWLSIYSGYCSAMSCISRPKQPLGWGSPCHRLHMNSLRYSCYLLTIDQVSTDRVLTNYWPIHRWSIDELSAKRRWSIGERKSISAETHLERLSTVSRTRSRPTIDRLSTACRPTIDRVSTDYRPSVDRVSTTISTDRSVDTTYNKHDPTY